MKLDIKKIQEKFITKHMCKSAWSENGINICGISSLGIRKNYYDYVLQSNESLNDPCLTVGFEERIPKNNSVPNIFMGVRVFFDITGKIELH